MKVYLCARYSRFLEMQGYALELATLGIDVTSRWILGDHDIRAHGQSEAPHYMPLWAQEDYDDLRAADVCLSFTEGPGEMPGRSRGGRHVELGIALALNMRCVVVNARENVFHWLPQIEFYATWEDACTALQTTLKAVRP